MSQELIDSLEEHWEEVNRLNLARLRGEVRRTISHETAEIRLCLDRPEPNIRMALDRLRRIEEFLDSLKTR